MKHTSLPHELRYYHPFHFIRDSGFNGATLFAQELNEFGRQNNKRVVEVEAGGHIHHFYLEFLSWDTQFFGFHTYKLWYVWRNHTDLPVLSEAMAEFKRQIQAEKMYCFIEIPSEDIMLIHALGRNAFTLVETRLTWYRGNLAEFNPERFDVRRATDDDIPNLMRVAKEMRNGYDRFHADPVFSDEKADEFLATYTSQSVQGFADIVLVPAEHGVAPDSFLTGRYLKNEWQSTGVKASKMVLAAVSAATNKGWHKKLASEMIRHLRNEGAEYVFMNTQSTNGAMIHTWQHLGFRLGYTTHIFSTHNL